MHLEATLMGGKKGWLVLTLLDNGVGLGAGTDTGSSEGLQLVREKVRTAAKNADVHVGAAGSPWSTMARITLPLVLPKSANAVGAATARRQDLLEAHS